MKSSNKKMLALGSAGLVSLALLAGGATTANWSDLVNIAGGQITAGNLDVEKISSLNWYERSVGSANLDGLINLDTYRIVPGDLIQGIQDLDVALEGDNILAEFEISSPELSGDLFDNTHGVTVTYKLVDENDNTVVPATFYGLENAPFYVNPEDVTIVVDGNMDYRVIVDAYFDQDTPDQVRTQVQSELKKITATIKQVRKEAPVSNHRMDPNSTFANNNDTPSTMDNLSDAPEVSTISAPGPTFNAPIENGPIAQPNPYIDAPGPLSSTPYQVFNHATEFTSDGNMLIAGGQTRVATMDASDLTDRLISYSDNGAGEFTAVQLQAMPEALGEIEMTRGLDGKIYLPGGGRAPQGVDLEPNQADETYSNKMYIYDPSTDSWSTGADMPQPRKSLGVTTGLDGKIYAVGGYYYGYHSTVMIYDPQSDTWTQGADFPSTRGCNNASTAPNGRIYCYSNEKADTHMYIYDPTTNTWETSTIAPMWFGDVNMTSAVGNFIVIAGGQYYDVFKGFVMGKESTSFLVYNTLTDEWGYTDRSMSTPKYGFGVTEVGDDMKVYINGGYDMDLRVRSDVEVFDFDGWGFIAYPEVSESREPVVAQLSNKVVVSNAHTCEIRNQGEVWCWGYNGKGQLGNGTQINSQFPVKAAGLDNVTGIFASGGSTYAINSGGDMWAWGDNLDGKLGVGEDDFYLSPSRVSIAGVKKVAASNAFAHSAVLLNDGTVKVAGFNEYIGTDGISSNAYISPSKQFSNVKDIASSAYNVYVLDGDGTLWGTGWGMYGGLAGEPATTGWTQIGNHSDIEKLYGGMRIGGMYKRANGEVWGWGQDTYSTLGLGSMTNSRTLSRLPHYDGAKNIVLGHYHTLMLKNDGTVWANGRGVRGQNGVGGFGTLLVPTKVDSLSGVKEVYASHDVSSAITDNKRYAWGDNLYLQLGVSSTYEKIVSPQEVVQ